MLTIGREWRQGEQFLYLTLCLYFYLAPCGDKGLAKCVALICMKTAIDKGDPKSLVSFLIAKMIAATLLQRNHGDLSLNINIPEITINTHAQCSFTGSV